ncbi:hypothetical protein ACFVAV_26115 [Nocardia sp. NPDC057663]|uniref:hypothetical protein n=1 Tax=Nocardia sp. NPDC057663 TaxID=3346201 RepID=UPI00366FC755
MPVFAKRVPLTERELAHRGSTANLFDLPVFCQYGIGGPGFNAWRELAANIVVTEGVLAGETQAFPMLYHWRVLPGRAPIADEYVVQCAAGRIPNDVSQDVAAILARHAPAAAKMNAFYWKLFGGDIHAEYQSAT